MKHKNIKNILTIGILFLVSSFFLWNCETDEYFIEETSSTVEEQFRHAETMSLDKLPIKLINPVSLLEKTIENTSRSTDDFLIIDENQIIAIIDSLSNTKYSIRFSLPNQPVNVLYNLILGTDSENSEIDPFVLKYTIDNIEEVHESGSFDFSKMKGKISEYRLDTFLAYIDSVTDSTNDPEPTPCDDYTTTNDDDNNDTSNNDTSNNGSTGGGSNGSNNGTGPNGTPVNTNPNGNFSFPEFENLDAGCNISSYSIWSNGTTGEVIGITWTCNDGSTGSAWNDRTSDNDDDDCPGNGDVPVNPREDLPPYPHCSSFEYSK